MADQRRTIPELEENTAPAKVDLLVIEAYTSNTNTVTQKVTINSVLSNTANANVTVENLKITKTDTPANSTISVAGGLVWFDSNYMYVAVANNSVKRISLESF